jgi:predicted MFS family arabinose efflux permease
MAAAEALRLLAFVLLMGATALGHVSLPLLAVLGFLGAAGTVGFSVAAPALVPALVPRAQLAQANGRLELARSAAFAAGPALAGALVAWAGASAAFVLAAMLSALALLCLLQLPETPRVGLAPRRHPWVEISEGARLVWHHALLRPVLLTAVVWNLAWFVLQAAYVPYAMQSLQMDASAVGLSLACYGVGMVVGALAAPRVMQALAFGRAIALGPLVSVLAAAVMASSLIWPVAALAALALFLFGAGPIIWTISSTTLRQTVTPSAMLGRVTAIFLAVNMGARPLGAALGGVVGESWGAPGCLLLALAGFVLQALVVSLSVVSRMQRLPAAAD